MKLTSSLGVRGMFDQVLRLAVLTLGALAVGVVGLNQTLADTTLEYRAQGFAASHVDPADPSSPKRIVWDTARWPSPLSLLSAAEPNAAVDAMTVVAEGLTGGHWEGRVDTPSRAYLALVNADNQLLARAAVRLLPVAGGRNFRDLGGYPTADGRMVSWGSVYRSGTMHGLTSADYDYLRGLGIAVVCDLRATAERDSEPTRWAAGDVDYLSWDYENDTSSIAEAFMHEELTPQRMREAMQTFYREIPFVHAHQYRALFQSLVAGRAPVAFNCSAGKDRAGMAAALILTALGVERETVRHDYALSDSYVDYMAEMVHAVPMDDDHPYAFLREVPEEVLAPLLESDPAYLDAAFAEVERRYGSVLAYIEQELGVDEMQILDLRARLLTHPPS